MARFLSKCFLFATFAFWYDRYLSFSGSIILVNGDDYESDYKQVKEDYVFLVSGKKNVSGLLVRSDIVASIENDHVRLLCQRGACESTSFQKEAEAFWFWEVIDDRNTPETFSLENYEATTYCTVNYQKTLVTITTTDDPPYIECQPKCKDGDVLICDQLAVGIVRRDDGDLTYIVTTEELGDIFSKREGAGKANVPKASKPSFAKPDTQESEEVREKLRNVDGTTSAVTTCKRAICIAFIGGLIHIARLL
ncbi:hypothetical protein Trydic_g11114 [Trypoxylus dichotomus]